MRRGSKGVLRDTGWASQVAFGHSLQKTCLGGSQCLQLAEFRGSPLDQSRQEVGVPALLLPHGARHRRRVHLNPR